MGVQCCITRESVGLSRGKERQEYQAPRTWGRSVTRRSRGQGPATRRPRHAHRRAPSRSHVAATAAKLQDTDIFQIQEILRTEVHSPSLLVRRRPPGRCE